MTTIDTLATCTQQNRDAVYTLLRRYFTANRTLLLQSDLREGLLQTEQDCGQSDMLRAFVFRLQEGIFSSPWAYLALRPEIAKWEFMRIHQEHLIPEKLTISEF